MQTIVPPQTSNVRFRPIADVRESCEGRSVSKRRLEIIRWTSAALCFACWGAAVQLQPKGGMGMLLLFGGFLLGLPGAMLTLHLHPPKWFRNLERPDR